MSTNGFGGLPAWAECTRNRNQHGTDMFACINSKGHGQRTHQRHTHSHTGTLKHDKCATAGSAKHTHAHTHTETCRLENNKLWLLILRMQKAAQHSTQEEGRRNLSCPARTGGVCNPLCKVLLTGFTTTTTQSSRVSDLCVCVYAGA